MELLRIRFRDIRPDENNPRDDFGDIAALAESFKLNPADPGEPLQPIVTVRDGNVYRIVDGERRYRAMRELGAIECWSNVCDDFGEADAVVQMLATNDKRELSDIERSRGVQTMLLLGVDEKVVESAGRIEGAGRVRRAMEAVKHRAKTMTIGHLLAIAEAEEAGDDDAVKALETCDPGRWERVAGDAAMRRRNKASIDAILDAARSIGYEVLADEPRADAFGDHAYVSDGCGEDRLRALFEQGYTHINIRNETWGYYGYVYGDLPEQDEDPQEAERRRAIDEAAGVLDAMSADAMAWLGGRLAQGGVPKAFAAWMEGLAECRALGSLRAFEEAAGATVSPKPSASPVLAALAAQEKWPRFAYRDSMARAAAGDLDLMSDYIARVAAREMAFFGMLAEAGWTVPDWARGAYERVAEVAAASIEEGDDGDDGDDEDAEGRR